MFSSVLRFHKKETIPPVQFPKKLPPMAAFCKGKYIIRLILNSTRIDSRLHVL